MTIRHLLAAALFLGSATSAMAFDLPPPVDAPEYTGSIAGASGWYIRGDLGYNGAIKMDSPSVRSFTAATDKYSTTKFDSARLSSDYSVNTGIGYQFNDWLRSDLTVDYFTGDFSGKSTSNTPCKALLSAGTKCGSAYTQSLASLGLLANGYVDLGTYWGVTPYLGAGAGLTNMDWGKVTESRHCVNGSNACNNFTKYANQSYEGAESWRFTYALMAGLSYDISSSMKLDFGYRFSQIAGGDMFSWSEKDSNNGAQGMKGEDKGLMRHEFRAGLRVTTW